MNILIYLRELILNIKNELGNFGEKLIWYVCAYVEHITLTLTLTLTFEGFKTLIFSVTLTLNSTPPSEEMPVGKSYLGLGLLPATKT